MLHIIWISLILQCAYSVTNIAWIDDHITAILNLFQNECSIRKIPGCPGTWSAFFDLQATLIFIGWFAFQAVLYMLPIGSVVQGPKTVIGNHQSLKYRCNGRYSIM